jgi:hypothetical protein
MLEIASLLNSAVRGPKECEGARKMSPREQTLLKLAGLPTESKSWSIPGEANKSGSSVGGREIKRCGVDATICLSLCKTGVILWWRQAAKHEEKA